MPEPRRVFCLADTGFFFKSKESIFMIWENVVLRYGISTNSLSWHVSFLFYLCLGNEKYGFIVDNEDFTSKKLTTKLLQQIQVGTCLCILIVFCFSLLTLREGVPAKRDTPLIE